LISLLLLLGCREEPTEGLCDAGAQYTVQAAGLTVSRGGCASLELSAELHGTGDLALIGLEVDPPVFQLTVAAGDSGGTFEGLTLRGPWTVEGPGDAVWWRQGYQSWSWSGVTALDPAELDDEGQPKVGGDGDAADVIQEQSGTSWWTAVLGRAEGASIGVGVLSAERTKFHVAVTSDELILTYGLRGGTITLGPNETLALAPLWIQTGTDASGLLEDYAVLAAERSPARGLGREPPTGWLTWYEYYEDIDEDIVRAELAAAEALNADPSTAQLEVFQIDDGWQEVWGDWTAREDFPGGMPLLAADIQASGMTPGLWLAPLYVDRSTGTYAEHPDWWVRHFDGDELRFTNVGTGDYAVLDVTHPDARAWLQSELARLVADGWTYLKLDFLYAGTQEGLRHSGGTGVESYATAMALIEEAVGSEVFLLASGAPMLPSLGHFDGFRTGSDIAFFVVPDPDPAFLRWAGRATAGRSWANGRWWWSDPDPVLIRDPFTDAQVRGALAAQVASGGSWFLGDSLLTLSPERLAGALDPELVATRGQTVRVLGPLASVSGQDGGPVFEQLFPDDQVAPVHVLADGTVVTLNLGSDSITLDRPTGVPILMAREGQGDLVLEGGDGEVWR
jgi:alpha-galactosidase